MSDIRPLDPDGKSVPSPDFNPVPTEGLPTFLPTKEEMVAREDKTKLKKERENELEVARKRLP